MQKMRRGNAIIDLQYGSTGKGLIAGYLAERDQPDTIVTAWAANAGHTYIDKDGHKFVHTMVANGIVSKNLKRLMLGPGSLINPRALRMEIDAAVDVGLLPESVRVMIHPQAVLITDKNVADEQGPMTKIGSTKKGVGEAQIQRIRRDPDNMNTARVPGVNIEYRAHSELFHLGLGGYVVTEQEYAEALDEAEVIQIEGAQGYSLSIYHGMYPYTTSRDVTFAQMMADCAIPKYIAEFLTVVGTCRTFPIRVANRFDEAGNQVGYSGGWYPDQAEISFAEIGQEVELTTVTKLPRRIATFSDMQIREAVRMNGVDELFVNFVNYMPPDQRVPFLDRIKAVVAPYGCRIHYIGEGPTHWHVSEISGGL